mgnify:CR=1 FL=1
MFEADNFKFKNLKDQNNLFAKTFKLYDAYQSSDSHILTFLQYLLANDKGWIDLHLTSSVSFEDYSKSMKSCNEMYPMISMMGIHLSTWGRNEISYADQFDKIQDYITMCDACA